MEAIISRFDRRYNAGLQNGPPTKDQVKKAIKRQNPARCPSRLYRLSYDVMIRHGDAFADLFYEFPDDIVFVGPYHIFVGYQPPETKNPIKPIKVLMEASEWTDEWGTRWAHAFGGVGGTPVAYPLQDWSQLDDYLAHKFPNPNAPGRLEAARKTVETYKKTKYCMGTIQMALFERFHCLRSMENTFEDFYTYETETRRLLDALTEYDLQIIRAWGKFGADGLLFTDDWGTQTALMISPEMWRKFFKPLYRKLFDEVHRAGMDVCFHSCGNVTEIVADLIDIGLDTLDPLQPGAMDLKEIARNFGGKITFHGGIDDQHVMTKASPRELKDHIRWLIDTLGKPFNNGYILSPANSIPPETPIENLRALFEACHGK